MVRSLKWRAGLLAASLLGSTVAVGVGEVVNAGTAAAAVTTVASGNPIPAENAKTGTDRWQLPWDGYQISSDINGGEVKGFATKPTVTPGSSISFKVTVNPVQNFAVDIYRLGYYQGLGGRLMTHVATVSGVHQPKCSNNSTSGEISCKNWSTSYTLSVPSTWVSGVYEAVFSNAHKFQSATPFWVADYNRSSDVVFVSSLNTYEAYNNYPWDTTDPNAATPPTGRSLYDFNSAGGVPAYQVTFDRPFTNEYGGDGMGGLGDFEPEAIYFLEKNGYDVSYTNDVTVDQTPALLQHHRDVVLGGHSEYWSKGGYDALYAARDKGVGLAFMSSNEIFWQIRYVDNSRREIICHKNYTADPITDSSLRTVNWRASTTNSDTTFNQDGPGRPEQQLIGVQLPMWGWKNWGGAPFVVKGTTTTEGAWVYAGTGLTDGKKIPSEKSGTYSHLVGYEMDNYDSRYPKPSGTDFTILAASPFTNFQGTKFTHNSSIYKSKAGNYVWASGTMGWSWGLAPGGVWDETDPNPEGPDPADNVAPTTQTITKNVLNKEISLAPTPLAGGNDFSISVSPSIGAVEQGGSTKTTVSTSVAFGSSETVSLSASGLPTGVSAAFSSTSVTSGKSSTLTFTASSSATTGSFTVTVKGSASSGSHSTSYKLVVEKPGSTNGLLQNGGFETSSLSPWTCQAGGAVVTSPVHSGSFALKVNPTSSTTGECDQKVTLVANHTYTFSGYVQGNFAFLTVNGKDGNWTSSSTWTKETYTFTTDSTGQATVGIHGWYGDGAVYADDFTIS